MRLWHEELDDAAATVLRSLFLFKYLTDLVYYLQRPWPLFNLTGFRSFLMILKVVLTSSRCVQWQIIDFSVMRWLRSRLGCFDPVLK